MATLLLATGNLSGIDDRSDVALSSPSLRDWLHEGWAILFSHPDDFVSCDLEMDRWLVITRRAFAARRIRPIALASPKLDPDRNWVTHVSGDNRTVVLEDPTRRHFGPVDLQTPVLREAIEQSGQRFVMIVDGALRIQKTFTYRELSNLPSPLELLGWAEALRAKQAVANATVDTHSLGRRAQLTHMQPFLTARRHKHRIPQAACAPVPQARAGESPCRRTVRLTVSKIFSNVTADRV